MLLASTGNKAASRLLAALLAAAVLQLMPYVLGFAGFYDVYPWLSFAPFDWRLFVGPLLFLYLRRLTTSEFPPGWPRHFVLPSLYLTYQCWAFSLPFAQKMHWNDSVHVRWIEPLAALASIASLASYVLASNSLRARYMKWLGDHVSDRELHRQPWILTILVALGIWLGVATLFEVVDRLVAPLSYYDRFPQYLAFGAIIFWLGLEGWRHATHRFPQMLSGPTELPSRSAHRDWPATASRWVEQIRLEGWWKEPGLSLSEVARRLTTNESYVSRAFNEGLGRNFNAVINSIRIEAVKEQLMVPEGRDLLTLAMDSGFSSKPSFNRVFREQTGMSPTAWRAAHSLKSVQITDSETPTASPSP